MHQNEKANNCHTKDNNNPIVTHLVSQSICVCVYIILYVMCMCIQNIQLAHKNVFDNTHFTTLLVPVRLFSCVVNLSSKCAVWWVECS